VVEPLVSESSPIEFFREQLERAMEHQRIATSAFTQYYLVNLLVAGVRGEPLLPREAGYDETPLALMYVRALQASRAERGRLWRALGDNALFVAGFFSDSLAGKLVDFEYYRALGGRAYAQLSREDSLARFGPEVFGELAERFAQFADLLSEVSENTRLDGSNRSILDLYERWQRTHSQRAARLLAERGLAPLQGDGRLQ